MLTVSHLILAVTMLFLQGIADSPLGRVAILLYLNCCLALGAGLFARQHMRGVLQRHLWTLLICSVGYCFAFGLFVALPSQMPLGLFMISSALAPVAGAWVYSIVLRRSDQRLTILGSSPILILFVLAVMESRADGLHRVSAALVMVALGQIAVQYGLRRMASDLRPIAISACLAAFNSVFLSAFLFGDKYSLLTVDRIEIVFALCAAPAVLAVQVLRLSGLKLSSLTLGAVAMSASVPVSLIVEEVHSGAYHPLSLLLSVVYVIPLYSWTTMWRTEAAQDDTVTI